MRTKVYEVEESLCARCRWGMLVHGRSMSQTFQHCDHGGRNIPFAVDRCSDFDPKDLPSKHEFEAIAWDVTVNRRTGTIGFRSPGQRRKEEA